VSIEILKRTWGHKQNKTKTAWHQKISDGTSVPMYSKMEHRVDRVSVKPNNVKRTADDKAQDLLLHRTSIDGKLVCEVRPVYNQQKHMC
jgi:hypothetical protein